MSNNEKNKNIIIDNYTDNVEELYNDFVKSLKDIEELCKNNPSKIKKSNINKSSVNIEILDQSEEKDLCKLIDDTIAWTEWSSKLTEAVIELPIKLAEFIANILGESIEIVIDLTQQGIDKLIKWINNKLEKLINDINSKLNDTKNKLKNKTINKLKKIEKIIKKVIKKIKLLTLKIKKFILDAQLWVYKITKSILESLSNGRIARSLDKTFNWLLTSLKTCAAAITAGLSAIQLVTKSLLAAFLAIEAGTMAFLFAPKNMITGKLMANMKPIEPGNDLFSFGAMDIIDKIVYEYISSINKMNEEASVAYITSKTTEYLVTGNISSGNPQLNKIDAKKLKSIIQNSLNLLLNLSEPLPKYEKLSITNLRFLMWLTTVFEPTMKTSFGIPGMP